MFEKLTLAERVSLSARLGSASSKLMAQKMRLRCGGDPEAGTYADLIDEVQAARYDVLEMTR